MRRDEFCRRFSEHLMRLLHNDEKWQDYADDMGHSYFNDPELLELGPAECATLEHQSIFEVVH